MQGVIEMLYQTWQVTIYEYQVKIKEPIATKIFSQGSLACQQASLVVKAGSLGDSRVNRHHKPSLTQRRHKNLHKMRALNFKSNLLEWLLALHRGISPRTPHKSPGDSHEQSPTLAKAPPLLKAI